MSKGQTRTIGSNVAVAKDFASRMMDCNKESGSMWCSKGTVFSYDTPIATFVEDPHRQLHVVFSTKKHSLTTTKHAELVYDEVVKMSHRVIKVNREFRHAIRWDELTEDERKSSEVIKL